MKTKLSLTCLLMALLFASVPAFAQEEWEYAANLYLWGCGLDGTIAAQNQTVEVDQSFGDILSNLEFAFMGAVRASNGQWSVTGDIVYAALGASTTGPLGNPIEVDVDQVIIGGDLGYEVADKVEVLAGARFVHVSNTIDFRDPLNIEVDADRNWVDPIIGVRFMPDLTDNLSWWTRFDLGGFDVGSDFTWQLNSNLLWRFSERAGLAFGYRVIDIKYDDEEGDNEFVYDIVQHGPVAGLVVKF